jgi:hypothetical protein
LLVSAHVCDFVQCQRLRLQDRRAFLQYAAKGCTRFDLNRPAWALESDVKQLGGLIYW